LEDVFLCFGENGWRGRHEPDEVAKVLVVYFSSCNGRPECKEKGTVRSAPKCGLKGGYKFRGIEACWACRERQYGVESAEEAFRHEDWAGIELTRS
jgi:hypothetical protein